MEELKSKINEWVQVSNDLAEYDKVIENFLSELEQQAYGPDLSLDKTPKQPKKKRNVPSIINENVNVTESTENLTEDKSTKNSLNPKDLSGLQSVTNERPIRAAKDKACANLKEPAINTKMRNEIKKERISNTSLRISNTSLRNAGPSNMLTAEHNEDNTDTSDSRVHNGVASEIRLSNNKKVKLSSQGNSSLELLPPADVKIELLSDDEKDKMPPPSQPPLKSKKKVKAATKSSNSSVVDKVIPANEIKQEQSEIASTITAPIPSNTRSKRTKDKGTQNKSEGDDSKSQEKSTNEIDQNHIMTKQAEMEKLDVARKEGVAILNATFESVYEDAMSESTKKCNVGNNDIENIKNVSVVLRKLTNSEMEALKLSGIQIPEYENVNNDTFNMNVTRTVDPCETFVAEQVPTNSTFVVPEINGTIVINANQKEDGLQSSLITDDESETEEIFIEKTKKTGKNEIFNPLIQSPVRKKVQAFEQHAAKNLNLGSPAGPRCTRVKSRVQDLKENRDTNTPVSRIPKPETPNTDPKPHRYLTPKETSSSSLVAINIKKKYNSTSKLQSGSSGGVSSKSSTSRENSVEDLKRGANAIQMAAEEKKRKREEKQKHAQQIREAKEREKREAAERVAREKQEKCKKLLQEREEKARQEFEKKKIMREHKLHKADLQKNLEEIQKNLQISKHLEQKRDESILHEMQKKKLADKERGLLEVARMAAMRDEINRNLSYHVQETSTSKPKRKQYDFDLLLSGDSTDEEDKQSTKKPPPPTWSLSKVRHPVIREQRYVQWKVVDKLFSVQPMTIDLQEIFPTIDSRYLKRNSSVIWSTPPRYSEIPKY